MERSTEAAPAARGSADMHPESRRLYRLGTVSVVMFLIVGIAVPMTILNAVDYDTELPGRALLEFIGAHRTWWIWLQTLTMGSMVFLIPPLVALYPALMHGHRAWALLGVVLAVSCQVLFMAYFPVVNGLVWLADRYAATSDPDYRAALVGGAEALVAQNAVYGTSDGIFALSVGAIAWAMRQSVFPRWVAAAGFMTMLAGVGGAFLKPWLGIHYLWWWLALIVWLVGSGITLGRLGWRAG